MGKIQQEFGDQGVSVVAINTAPFSSLSEWRDFWKSKDAAEVIWATDARGDLIKRFEVLSLGTTIIIDREGYIAYRDDGATPYEVLRTEVVRIL